MPADQVFKIASIPADGVGKEVVAAGIRVLDTVAEQSGGKFAFDWTEFPWGSEYYAEHGRMMAEDGLETLKDFDTGVLADKVTITRENHVGVQNMFAVGLNEQGKQTVFSAWGKPQ